MQKIRSYDELKEMQSQLPILLVYLSSADCSVCAADAPRTARIAEQTGIPAVQVEISEVPEAAGQLNVFSAPAVLLFAEGREYHRQARFLDFAELERRIRELQRAAA